MELQMMKMAALVIVLDCILPGNSCPKKCLCSSAKNLAHCINLYYIPELPKYVTTLRLTHCILGDIKRMTFKNVSEIRLQKIIFEHNSLHKLCNDSFNDLKHLRALDFQYEYNLDVLSLRNSFQSLNSSLVTRIVIENCGWETIPWDLFNYLAFANLSTVSFKSNKIVSLDTTAFTALNSIDKLSFENNEIVFVNASGLKNIKSLDLSTNNIYEVPSFCFGKMTLVPQMIALNFRDNPVRRLSNVSFECLQNLETLILENIRVKQLPDNSFVSLNKLRKLSLSHNPQLNNISRNAFSSSSLKDLRFAENGFRFDDHRRFKVLEMFSSIPNLRELDLTKNHLSVNEYTLFELLSPLTRLEKLVLKSTWISIIPNGLFQKMKFLDTLILSGNRIESWNSRVFHNITKLRDLDMAGNLIHFINESSFPNSFLKSLKWIDLSGNPFFCTCEQKWFLDMIYISNLNAKLKQWPRQYRCSYPESLKRSKLANYHPTVEECTEKNQILLIVVTAAAVGFLLLVIPLVFAICQTNIRNILYLFRIRRRMKSGYLRLACADDFEFDAFIIYCDADRKWVHGKLLKCLEEKGLSVCVHHRDFVVGESITTNIESYMSKSFKTIVVMTNQFAKSEWCQWEIDLVQERRRRQGKEALVLIMYRQIDSRHMTSPLRTLLRTTPYLRYKEGFGENMFWTAVISDVQRPLSIPPMAVL